MPKSARKSPADDDASRGSDPQRRAAILAAAEKLFRHYGPAKTTIGDIAREASIGVGSIYLEFDSKDAIVGELSARRHDRVLTTMRAASQRGSHAERLCAALEARIEALFDVNAEGVHSCDLVMCSSGSVKRSLGRFRAEELDLIVGLLEQGATAGDFREADARQVAELIERAHASFNPPWLFEQNRREVLRQVRAMNNLLLHGVLAGSKKRTAKR